MYFHPKVIYFNEDDKRENSIIRYIGHRVLENNKNFLCALTGKTGAGKSYCGLKICELYSKMFNIPFDPEVHVISSLKELLILITSKDLDKKIQKGSIILFDEPQVENNARNWQSEMNQAFSQLISTFRNQNLVVLFATPFLHFIDKQSRILFHGDFNVLGYNKNTKITKIKPRFIEYSPLTDITYKKKLIIVYRSKEKSVMVSKSLNTWEISIASDETIKSYESKKKKFTDDLNLKLLSKLDLQEKREAGRDRSQEFFRVKELFLQYGDDMEAILKEMPQLTPFVIEKYLQMVKKGIKNKKK